MANLTSIESQKLNVTSTGQPLSAGALKKPIYILLELYLILTIASAGVLLNAVELFILQKNHKNRTYNEILLMNLSMADLLFSISEIILTSLHSIVLTDYEIWHNISKTFCFNSTSYVYDY